MLNCHETEATPGATHQNTGVSEGGHVVWSCDSLVLMDNVDFRGFLHQHNDY